MAGAVGDVLDEVLAGAGVLDDAPHDLDVRALVGAADVVGLARRAVLEDVADGAREVLDVEPVAHVHAVAVDRQAVAVQRVEDHQRDELLRVLVGPVVVRSAADQRLDAERVVVGGDEQVGAGLRRAVRRGRRERRLLGERALGDRAVDLVGGDLHQAHAARPRGLEQHVGADGVRAHERVGRGDRAIDVGLGGEVDDGVGAVDRLGHRARVLDRAVEELVLGVLQALAPPRVGELVQDDDVVAVVARTHAREVRADEARAAADQQPHRVTAALSSRYAATPSCHGGRIGAASRSVARTE